MRIMLKKSQITATLKHITVLIYIYSLMVFKTQQSFSFTNVLVVKVENHKRDFDVFDNHPL